MHQHPRTPPVTASPARSPQTNPMRTNNPRDQSRGSSPGSVAEKTSSVEAAAAASEGGKATMKTQEPVDKDNLAKLNQVVQASLIRP